METAKPSILSTSETSGWAIASLVTALTTVSPLAIIFGHLAISRIKNSPGQLTGFRLALAGTILGYVGSVIWLCTIFIQPVEFDEYPDRNICILQTRNIQQAVRVHQDMTSLKEGDPIDWDYIFGPDGYLKKSNCPTGGAYTFQKSIPKVGTLACTCSHSVHVPANHDRW